MADRTIIMVNVLYYLPDHRHLVGELLFQTLDLRPHYPRVHRFLDYWRREIDAVIKEIIICDTLNPATHLRHGKWLIPTQ